MSTILTSGSVEDFFDKARQLARKIDRGEKVETRPKVIMLEPEDMGAYLTPKRLKVLKAIRAAEETSVAQLVIQTKQDRASVSRTIKRFEELGVVITAMKKNPGHGQHKVVRMASEKLELRAEI